ncbi:MAG: hypothetical protein Kow00120_11730 [Anaerolineae bacterium]
MTVPKYEVCQLRYKTESGSLFSGPRWRVVFEAEKTSFAGSENIASVEIPCKNLEKVSEAINEAHNSILQRLLTDGWEPVGTDETGKIMAFRRPITDSE